MKIVRSCHRKFFSTYGWWSRFIIMFKIITWPCWCVGLCWIPCTTMTCMRWCSRRIMGWCTRGIMGRCAGRIVWRGTGPVIWCPASCKWMGKNDLLFDKLMMAIRWRRNVLNFYYYLNIIFRHEASVCTFYH